MIDTLLTADAMTIRYEELADAVVLASDDDDLIPAMLALAASGVGTFDQTQDAELLQGNTGTRRSTNP